MLDAIKAAGWLRQSNFINGQWVDAADGRTLAVENPANAEQLGTIAWSAGAEARLAMRLPVGR